MPGRVLTQRQLNRALLARQLLLERVALPIPRVLERVSGIQNQYAPNAYIRLWSCLEDFRRDDLGRALERRSVVQGTLMRETIHLVSAREYWLFAAAIRSARRAWWLRLHKNVKAPEMVEAAERLRRHLAGRSRRGSELKELIGWRAGVHLWLDLVRTPPSGTWERRRADLYADAQDWLGPGDVDEDEALDHVVRRYLGGFGPASRADIASWSGVPVTQLAGTLERLSLRRFRDGEGRELLDLPRAPLPDPGTPAPVRFLPTWDATLLVHARRTGILPERYRPIVFNTKIPPSMPTFLVDGAVAGSWMYENSRVELSPFDRIDRATRRELREEADRLAALHE